MAFSGSTTSAGREDAVGTFQFSDLARVAGQRARFILTVATLIVVLTIVALIFWPSTYSASTVVMLDQRINNVAQNSAVLSSLPTDPASVQNQIQVLTSRDLAARVIADLQLYEDPEFSSPALFSGDYPSADTVIDNFLRHLTVEAQGLSTTLTITFKSSDPNKAARIANAIADAYLADQVNVEDEATRTTTEWLNTRIRALARQVQAAEAAVQQYRAQNNLNDTSDGTSLIDQQLIAENTALVQAKSDLAEKQAMSSHINSMIALGQGADVSQVVASPLIVQLRTQEADIMRQEAQYSSKYGPRHPKIVDIESQKQNLQDKIVQEATRIGGSAANDVAIARAQVGSLSASLKQLEARETSESMARVKLKALEANAASTRTMYEAFVTRLRETQGSVGLPDARVISRAAIPTHPSSPKRTMIAAASVPVGLLVGLLLALIAERSSPAAQYRPATAWRQAPIQAAVDPLRGAPVLGDIPDYPALRAADLVIDRPSDAYSRSVDALLSRIAPQIRGAGGKVIALTAPDQNEGRTALSASLARAASQRGYRVIVIDGDFQWPRVSVAMGLNPMRQGLQDVLSGATPLSQGLARDTRSASLLLSPVGASTPNTSFVNALPQLIAYLKRTFDLVIVDCPTPAYANPAQALLPLSDAALLLVRWQTTPRASVTQTLDTLAAMRVPAGVVFAR